MSDQERPEVHLATGDLSYSSTDEAFHHTRAPSRETGSP
jgi:hypothetical protein